MTTVGVEVGVDAAVHAEAGRERAGRDRRDRAVGVGRADAEADEREHVRAGVHERRPHALEERPAAPEHHRRRERELDPVHERRADRARQRTAGDHVAHREQEDRQRERRADPEPARHVDRARDSARSTASDEASRIGSSAMPHFGHAPGPIADDLGIHRARIPNGGAAGWGWRLRRLAAGSWRLRRCAGSSAAAAAACGARKYVSGSAVNFATHPFPQK